MATACKADLDVFAQRPLEPSRRSWRAARLALSAIYGGAVARVVVEALGRSDTVVGDASSLFPGITKGAVEIGGWRPGSVHDYPRRVCREFSRSANAHFTTKGCAVYGSILVGYYGGGATG